MLSFLKKGAAKKENCCNVEIMEVEEANEKNDACCSESSDDKACC